MVYQLIASLLVLQSVIGYTEAQLPSVWKPYDVVTYFCSRWYHQCETPVFKSRRDVLTPSAVVKNDVLYVYGGIQTFNVPNLTVKSTNNTLGYSKRLLSVIPSHYSLSLVWYLCS